MNYLTVANTQEKISFYTASVSQSLDNWLWDFSAEISQETFERIKPQKSLHESYIAASLKIGSQVWQLIIDKISSNDTSFQYSIGGFSKTALLGEPFALHISKVWRYTMASAIVQELCNNAGIVLHWEVPDWPVKELAEVKKYPIDIVLDLVGDSELKAAVLAMPDGSLKITKGCINPKNLQTLGHDYSIATDKNLFERSYQFVNNRNNFNQISVINDLEGAENGSLSITEEQNGNDRLLKIYPTPWIDNISLAHTSGDNVSVYYEGIKTEANKDNVLIEQGKGKLSKAVYQLNSIIWQQQEAGILSINEAGDIDSSTLNFGLVSISYKTRYHQYRIQKFANIQLTGIKVTADYSSALVNEGITLVINGGGRLAEKVIVKTLSTQEALLFRAEAELFRQVYDAEEHQISCAYQGLPMLPGKIAALKINAEAKEFNAFITSVSINIGENDIMQSVKMESYLV